jgi:septal ring factor EnvC (AmiA/AmiB activator)
MTFDKEEVMIGKKVLWNMFNFVSAITVLSLLLWGAVEACPQPSAVSAVGSSPWPYRRQADAPALKPPEAPKVPESVKVKILQSQLEQEKLQRQFESLNSQMNAIKAEYPKTVEALKKAEDEAFSLTKLDRKEWALDTVKMEFVAAPKPAAPAATPIAPGEDKPVKASPKPPVKP